MDIISLTLAEAIVKDEVLIKNIVIIIVCHYNYRSIFDVFLFILNDFVVVDGDLLLRGDGLYIISINIAASINFFFHFSMVIYHILLSL